MKKKLFIIGGAGNVYLQKLYMNSQVKDYKVSKFLVSQRMRKLLGHTHHHFSAEDLLELEYTENIFSGIVLLIDLFFGKLFAKTLITEVDLNLFKCRPLLGALFYVGYFQDKAKINFHENDELIRANLSKPALKYDLCIHFRGGDFIKYGSQISPDYYRRAIDLIGSKVGLEYLKVAVVTNDRSFAVSQLEKISYKLDYSLICGNALDDINSMMASKHLIISNSTFSLIAAIERNEKGITVLPKEFSDKFHIDSNNSVYSV